MAAQEKTAEIHPEAHLEPRDGDLEIPLDQLDLYAKMSLFAGKEKDVRYFEKFPGSAMVRRYRKGEVVCRQGEPGWTAFYILTSEDALQLVQALPKAAQSPRRLQELAAEAANLRETVAAPPPRNAATVHLQLARPVEKKPGWLSRAFRGSPSRPAAQPLSIPIDGPIDLNYGDPTAKLREGELFGEMSCFYRTPRSATVAADRDCYMLEMLRNILDKLKTDAKFRKRLDDAYRDRALGMQLRNIPVFADVSDALLSQIRDKAELKTFRAGQVLCDEHDRSDDMFLVRSGLVKVARGLSSLFTPSDVARWNRPAAAEAGSMVGPKARLWAMLPAAVQADMNAGGDLGTLPEERRRAVADAFNAILKGAALWKAPEFTSVARSPVFEARRGQLPTDDRELQELDARWLNRVVVEIVLLSASAFPRPSSGLETVLHYAARGEPIGEMGLASGEPRSATCVAYIHPREGQAQKEVYKPEEEIVEVVRISRSLFDELKRDESFRRRVEDVIRQRRGSDVAAQAAPSAVEAPLQRSEAFGRLGLVQGQKLMLIDLDRCTRCDECVRACVNVHDDGHSRLFLEGHRFDRYLIPLTCRSCLDPVCMRGCPVGAIHRGDNRQIVIEDWCIGCELCARQCPYSSIQMHDIGVVPQAALGWRFRPAEGDGLAWTKPGCRDADWAAGQAPFRVGGSFEEAVRRFGAEKPAGRRFWFRLTFHADRHVLKGKNALNLTFFSPDAESRVWINGHEVAADGPPNKKCERIFPIAEGIGVVRPGKNVLAASVAAAAPTDKVKDFFDLRIDVVSKPDVPAALAGQYVEKDVTLRAVVCDLCSSLPGQVPACVNACPHDAAMRFNARTEFPAR
jgi:Fe-S-cluster-containing hydrogenase component 2/CRP-like cAMP-binding protein